MNISSLFEATKPAPLQRPHDLHHDGASRDDKIIRAVEIRLLASPHFALRSITTEFRRGVIVLRGQVASDYLKFMAQETLRGIDGVSVISGVTFSYANERDTQR